MYSFIFTKFYPSSFFMKWSSSFIGTILAGTLLFTGFHVYANIDDNILVEHSYTCKIDRESQVATGELTLSLKYRGNTVITKLYTINNTWKIKSIIDDDPNNWFWTFGIEESANISIPGCGCPSALTGQTNYPSRITKDQSGSTVAQDYIFTNGSGSSREWARLADVIVLTPNLNGGNSRECGSGWTGTVDVSPVVSLTVSGNTLTGTVAYLTGNNAYSCLEIMGRTSGTGAEWYCTNDASRWQKLNQSQSGWTYASGTWTLSTTVGSWTAFPENVYRWYFKNSINNKIGKADFQVGNGNGTPVVSFTVSGNTLTGKVRNLSADNAYSCLLGPGINAICSSGTGSSNWVKMSSQSGWSYTWGVWYLTTSVGSWTAFPDGTYEWFWRNGTGGAIGKDSFTVDTASALRPIVSFTVSWSLLTGTVTRLTMNNTYSCIVHTDRGWFCRNSSGTNPWTRVQNGQSGWTYSGGMWYGSLSVLSGTEFSSGTHEWYWQEWTGGIIGSWSFTIGSGTTWSGTSWSGRIPVVTIMTSGSVLTGKVLYLSGTNASACLEVFWRGSGMNAEGACRSGTGSDWVKMPKNGWTYNSLSGTWEITRNVWPWTDMPNNRYAAFWKNDTTNVIGSWNFLVNVSMGTSPLVNISVMTHLSQSSTGMWQRLEWLTGTLTNLSQTNPYGCLEVVWRSTGSNMDGYCNSDMTHWTALPTQDWKFNAANQLWEINRKVGNGTDLPENTYRVFFKNGTGWDIGRGMFQVLVSKGLKIIGNVTGQWTQSYGKDAETSGNIADESRMNTLRNTLTSNIATLTRWVPDGTVVNGIIQFNQDVRYSSFANKDFSTIIVHGNLIVDSDISALKWIIVMKDSNGNKGNIIVEDSVSFINALIYTDGIFMGTSTDAKQPNPDLQLVLKGILLSRNTVGWSADPENLFLYPHQATTDINTAFMQDLNNVRSGNGWKAYLDTYIDAFIIDYDPSILTNTPPGFSGL